MTTPDLTALADKLDELAMKATPMPWVADDNLGCKRIKGGKSGTHRQAQYLDIAHTDGVREERDAANAQMIVSLVNALPQITTALREAARMREALADVQGVFEYLEADIEVDMDDGEDDSEPLPCQESDTFCGHTLCAQTGCVSMRLDNIRAALKQEEGDE